MKVKRPDWYEDDVIEYTSRGRLPKIPDKYKKCTFYIKHHPHTVKSFLKKDMAEIALSTAIYGTSKFYKPYVPDKMTIFKCKKCGMYHILTTENYNTLWNTM